MHLLAVVGRIETDVIFLRQFPERRASSVRTDHDRGWQPEERKRAESGPILVDEDREADANLIEELPDSARSCTVHRKGDDLKSFAAKPFLKSVECWHFGPAGAAPSRPDIEQHHFPAPVFEDS